MGELDAYTKSEAQRAIDRIVERRFKAECTGPSTDAIDRATKDRIRREVEDEYILMHGHRP